MHNLKKLFDCFFDTPEFFRDVEEGKPGTAFGACDKFDSFFCPFGEDLWWWCLPGNEKCVLFDRHDERNLLHKL